MGRNPQSYGLGRWAGFLRSFEELHSMVMGEDWERSRRQMARRSCNICFLAVVGLDKIGHYLQPLSVSEFESAIQKSEEATVE